MKLNMTISQDELYDTAKAYARHLGATWDANEEKKATKFGSPEHNIKMAISGILEERFGITITDD